MKQIMPGVGVSFKRDSESDSGPKLGLRATSTPTPHHCPWRCMYIYNQSKKSW